MEADTPTPPGLPPTRSGCGRIEHDSAEPSGEHADAPAELKSWELHVEQNITASKHGGA